MVSPSPIQSTLNNNNQNNQMNPVISPVQPNTNRFTLNIPMMRPQLANSQPTQSNYATNDSDLTSSLSDEFSHNPRAKAMTLSRAPISSRSTDKSHLPTNQSNQTSPSTSTDLDLPPSSSSSSAMTNTNGANSPISPISTAQSYQWREVIDVRGRSYYYNATTKETT